MLDFQFFQFMKDLMSKENFFIVNHEHCKIN